MRSNQDTALVVIGLVSLLSFFFYTYSDGITNYAKESDPWREMFVCILTNPVYIGLIVYMANRYQLRGLVSSFLIIIALDIQSLPHVVPNSGALPTDAASYLYMDTVFYRLAPWMGTFGLYVVLPTLLLVGAYYVVSPKTFVTQFKRYSPLS